MLKYLLLSLINTIYGAVLLLTLKSDTPGLIFVLFIALILVGLGLTGIVLSILKKTTHGPKNLTITMTLKSWSILVRNIDILLIVGLFSRIFIIQPFLVEGSSMEPNYHDKEFLLVDRLTYHFKSPQRGEVVIFRFPKNPQEDYIKRIIGLPGETIKIENGKVYINGQRLEEKYLSPDTQTIISNNTNVALNQNLSADEYFVMGDNRSHSSDSREWGTVPKNNFIGRSWFIFYPFANFGLTKNPQTEFSNSLPAPGILPTITPVLNE